MKRFCTIVMAALMIVSFSTPTMAQRAAPANKTPKKHQSSYEAWKARIHQIIAQYQFRHLKMKYDKAFPETRQLFLEYLGKSLPSSNEAQIQELKEAYEQTIAELNATIAAQQQQLEDIESQMNAACDARLAAAEAQCRESAQQQLNELSASHLTELNTLTQQMNTVCDERLAQAYIDWQAQACSDGQASSGPPQQTSVIATGSISPYGIDINDSGQVFVLDRDILSVAVFDSAGGQVGVWNPGTFVLPMDIAVDSQGAVYVLDQQAGQTLQKFSPDGAPLAFDTSTTPMVSPIGLFIDNNDNIYVTDQGGDYIGRVLVFNTSGNLVRTFGEVAELAFEEYRDIVLDENSQTFYIITRYMVGQFDINGNYQSSWSSFDFRSPYSIAVGANGDIFVADTYSNEIDQYGTDGTLKFSLAEDAYRPYRIVTDSSGRLYVADYGNTQVRIFK